MTGNVTWATSRIFASVCAAAATAVAGVAEAQSDKPWDGMYAGLNLGGASHGICQSWIPQGAGVGSAMVSAFGQRNCSNGATAVGGFQIGGNIQYRHLILGLGAELEAVRQGSARETLKYSDGVLPAGTYLFSGKLGPDGFVTLGPRVGYAGRQAMAYVTAGAALAAGPSRSQISFLPTGSAKPSAAFEGPRNFGSAGWMAGGGAEWGMNGPWSISATYLHVSLGEPGQSVAPCAGTAAACAVFSGLSFASSRTRFAENVFRIGVNYWFGYWEM